MIFLSRITKKIPYQIKASFVILLASFATSAIGFLTTPIFTRLMSVEEYGVVVNYNSILEVMTVIATLSLSAGVFQVAMNEFKNDRDSFTYSSVCLANIVTVCTFAIVFIFRKDLSRVLKLNENLFLCMFLFLLVDPAMTMWLARQRYEYQYKKVALLSVIVSVFSVGSGLIALSTAKNFNLGELKVWVTAVAQIICGIIIYISIARKSKWKPKRQYIRFAFLFNAPLLIHYLAQYILRSSDKVMITSICGERAAGLYGLGATVASIAIMAWGAMAASLTPYMYTHIASKEYEKVNRAAVAVIGVFGVCCVIVSLIGPEVVYILGSEKYIENIGLIPPIAASSLLSGVYGVYATIAFYYHKRTSTAIMTIIAALLNILLNYLLIPKYGYIAAAFTTEAAYLIYTFLHYLNYRIIVKKERIFQDKVIWGITILTTVVCMASGLLYSMWIARYCIFLLIVISLVLARKKIIEVIKTLTKNNSESMLLSEINTD